MSLKYKLQQLSKFAKLRKIDEAKDRLKKMAEKFPKDCMGVADKQGWDGYTETYDKSLLWDAEMEQEEFVQMVADACDVPVEELKVTEGNHSDFNITLKWGE